MEQEAVRGAPRDEFARVPAWRPRAQRYPRLSKRSSVAVRAEPAFPVLLMSRPLLRAHTTPDHAGLPPAFLPVCVPPTGSMHAALRLAQIHAHRPKLLPGVRAAHVPPAAQADVQRWPGCTTRDVQARPPVREPACSGKTDHGLTRYASAQLATERREHRSRPFVWQNRGLKMVLYHRTACVTPTSSPMVSVPYPTVAHPGGGASSPFPLVN